MLTNFRVLARV